MVAVRDRIQQGDELEFIGPGMRSQHVQVDQIQLVNSAGETSIVSAANPNQLIILQLPFEVAPLDLVRRQKKDPQ